MNKGRNLIARLENDTMANVTKKPTKAQMFKQILDSYELTPAEQEFIKHEMELLAKKNSAEKKPTAQQEANAVIKQNVLTALADGEKRTVSDLLKMVPDLPDTMTNQRMSALVRQMVDAGEVIRTEDKRKAYFSLA